MAWYQTKVTFINIKSMIIMYGTNNVDIGVVFYDITLFTFMT